MVCLWHRKLLAIITKIYSGLRCSRNLRGQSRTFLIIVAYVCRLNYCFSNRYLCNLHRCLFTIDNKHTCCFKDDIWVKLESCWPQRNSSARTAINRAHSETFPSKHEPECSYSKLLQFRTRFIRGQGKNAWFGLVPFQNINKTWPSIKHSFVPQQRLNLAPSWILSLPLLCFCDIVWRSNK